MSSISRIWKAVLLCVFLLSHARAEFISLSASSVEPTAGFSMQFRSAPTTKQQQHDVFSTLRIQRERELFHQQIMSDDSIQVLSPKMTAPAAVFGDSLHVRFTAFDETFDMELNADRNSIDSRTRVFAGVPEDETLYRPQLLTYTASTVDAQGAEITASFTVMHDKRIRGIFVRGGEIYQVAPMDHLEADLAVETRLQGTHSVQHARLSTLRSRAAASAGMVVYKLSELRTTNEAGEPQIFCSAVDPKTGESRPRGRSRRIRRSHLLLHICRKRFPPTAAAALD
jgi:hypothetical protein